VGSNVAGTLSDVKVESANGTQAQITAYPAYAALGTLNNFPVALQVNGSNVMVVSTGNSVTMSGGLSAASFSSDTLIANTIIANVSMSSPGNITGGNLIANTGITGTLTTAAQPNITSVGTLTSLTVTGNITGSNLNTSGAVTGNGRALTSLNATNIDTGTLDQARLANASLTVNGTSIALGGSGTITATATNALTIGTGLGGTSYNGSTGVTITNTGVTSVVAGTNIAVSGATGAVTISVTGTVPTAANAANLTTTNFSVRENSGKLYFYYGVTAIASLDNTGHWTTLGNITAFGTP
jgi:hypothetical protein